MPADTSTLKKDNPFDKSEKITVPDYELSPLFLLFSLKGI
jgi:hypothetical protein